MTQADLYFQHRIDSAVELEGVADTMAELIREGKILHWGISEANEGIDAVQKALDRPHTCTRKTERMQENAGAAQVKLTEEEVRVLDKALEDMEMSEVFGGSQITKSR